MHRVDNGFKRQAAYYLEFRGKSNLCVHDTVGGQIGGGFGGNFGGGFGGNWCAAHRFDGGFGGNFGGGFGGNWCAAHRFDGHADGRSATLELGSSLTFDC